MERRSFETSNPATGQVLETHHYDSASEVEAKIALAFQAYHHFIEKPPSVRQQKLHQLAQALRANQKSLARLMTLEMGKAISDSLAEIEKCAQGCEYFGSNLETFLKTQNEKTGTARAHIVKDPLGPVFAIMPWNFPIWQVIRFAAPAVGIGNPILLKHSNLMAGTAKHLAEIFDQVGKGLLFNLTIDHEQAKAVIADARVRGVTLTGSEKAGRSIGQLAGQHLKKHVLELGGSDAYIVCADSELESAAELCAKGRMVNNGQSCIAAKRFLVQKEVLPDFLERFAKHLLTYKWGDPLDPKTKVGSLAAKRFQESLQEQCKKLEQKGAQKIFDASEATNFSFQEPGAFFPPRIYQVSADLEMAFHEELFGPVALVCQFQQESDALALANRSRYGLGGAVFSQDIKRAEFLARRMECGFVAINDHVRSDPGLPFGGVKSSGYGRELSYYGFLEFCNVKSVTLPSEVEKSARAQDRAAE